MKLPPDTTVQIQACISIALAIAFTALIIFSHNPDAITASIAGLVGIYGHWQASPSQQSTLASLAQQITPVLNALANSPAIATAPVPAPVPTTRPVVIPTPEPDITASMKAVSPPAKEATA